MWSLFLNWFPKGLYSRNWLSSKSKSLGCSNIGVALDLFFWRIFVELFQLHAGLIVLEQFFVSLPKRKTILARIWLVQLSYAGNQHFFLACKNMFIQFNIFKIKMHLEFDRIFKENMKNEENVHLHIQKN